MPIPSRGFHGRMGCCRALCSERRCQAHDAMESERRLTCQEEMEQVQGDKARDQARGEAEAREAAGEAGDSPPARAETVCVPAADTR